MNGCLLIAEVKTHSPFGFHSPYLWEELFELARNTGDIISIHTDVRWGGSFDLLTYARALTTKPILAKGIHAHDDSVKRAVDAGADYVLVVGRVPCVYREQCFIEPCTLSELANMPYDQRVVWNSRDLKNGALKKETFAEARACWSGWLCQASIENCADQTNFCAQFSNG